MPAELVLYDGAGVAVTDTTLALGPGDTSATYTRRVQNDGDETATGVTLLVEALDGTTWKRQGMPILDQLWPAARIVSTSFDATTSGTKRLGSNSRLVLPDIPAAGYVTVEYEAYAPATIGTAAIETHLIADWARNSYGIAERIGMTGSGILPTSRDSSARRVVSGFDVTGSGAASVSVAAGLIAFDGLNAASIISTHTLNQNDSAAAALATGESYIARISADSSGARTATKGTKSATPSAPALPSNHVHIAYVTVEYQVGGTSIIDQVDVDQTDLIRGDYYFVAGVGLSVDIHAGNGIATTDLYRFHSAISTVSSLTASDTSYIWANPDGTFEATLTEVAPMDGAELLGEADTDGSSVTATRDRRAYLTRPFDEIAIRLDLGTVSAAQTAPADFDTLPADCEISRVRFEGGAVSGGASGSYRLHVATAPEGEPTAGTWTTIYTSSGTEDHACTIAYNATSLADESNLHEVRRVQSKRRVGAWVSAIPAGGTLTNARAIVYIRRTR